MNNENNLEDFSVGELVNVERYENDLFSYNFTGRVIRVNNQYITVIDQDDDCWDVDACQLSHCSDESFA